ncbi:MAG: HD domain-containing phosphohydrolase [Bdellovibrionales bacterium]
MHDPRLVAIIDSNTAHAEKVGHVLKSYYNMDFYDDGAAALTAMRGRIPAVIVVAPHVKPQGSDTCITQILHDPALKDRPIIYIAENEIDPQTDTIKALGVQTILTKPYTPGTLIKTVSRQISGNVEKTWESLEETPRKALQNSIEAFRCISDVLITGESIAFDDVKTSCQPLVDVVESNDFTAILDGVRDHDDYTYAHSMRVATLLTLLGHAAGFKRADQLIMSSGGLLHDVGKMKIPHNILNKPGRLTESEFEIMKSHVPETMTYLEHAGNIPKGVMIIAEQHHEKIDGTGYPHGLKGKELNELARMAAIVDVFSALTDRRVYKEPMESAKAMQIITEEMTGHLDQHYVKLFRGVLIDAGILV